MATRVKIIIAITMVLAHGFSYAQNVSESEAAVVAVKFMSDMKPHWTKDSVLSVHTLIRYENISVYEVVGCDGSSVLLSGRKECVPILGFISAENKPFSGSIIDHYEELPDGLRGLLNDYSNQVDYSIRHPVGSSNVLKWNTLLQREGTDYFSYQIEIDPLISTQWGQAESNDGCSGAYNHYCFVMNSCNNCPAGCVAVAMAQIMKYWTHPLNIPWRCEQFEWYNMPDQIIARNNPDYQTQRNATSKLIHNCGTSVHTNYCPNNNCTSGIPYDSLSNVLTVLRDTFGYNELMELKYKDWETNWETQLIAELQNQRPVFYFGIGTGGHAFVCDGCKANPSQQQYLFHFNWGWTGKGDGYFELSALTPYDGQQLHNYSNNQGAIFYISPSTCFQNIIMECDNNFAHTAIRSFSAVDDFSNNYHIYNINPEAKIYVHAGNEILLTDGFYAQQYSRFQATITPCSSSTTFLPDYFGNEDGEGFPFDTLATPKSLQQPASFADDATLKVYPNPAGDLLHIELAGGACIASATLYDLQGRTVRTRFIAPASSQTATVDVRGIPAGVYMLRVTDGEGKEYERKVVKR